MRTPASIGLLKMAAPCASLARSKLADIGGLLREKGDYAPARGELKPPLQKREGVPAPALDLLVADLAVVAFLPDVPDVIHRRPIAFLVEGDVADHRLEGHAV